MNTANIPAHHQVELLFLTPPQREQYLASVAKQLAQFHHGLKQQNPVAGECV